MINSIVTPNKTKNKNDFPKLMRIKSCGMIMLMFDSSGGMVVGNPKFGYKIGSVFNTWDELEPFDGTVTLEISNE